MSGIMIDPEKLIKFFDRQQEESCGYRYDISTTDELRQFLSDFCHNEEEQPAKSETCPTFDSITYFTRDQAQKHLELLRDAIHTRGKVSVQEYYRLAGSLGIIQKWIAMYFKSGYGWKDLSTVQINTIHCGGIDLWTLEMPMPKKLDI